MALTYTQAKATLDEIATRSENNRKNLQRARDLIASAGGDLNAMAAAYGTFVTDLDAEATANPGNAAWEGAKAEKDQMVSDFNALNARAINLLAAVDGVA